MQLEWQSLLPDSALVTALHSSTGKLTPLSVTHMQPRLQAAVSLFCQSHGSSRFMLLHADEGPEHLALVAQLVHSKLQTASQIHGVSYQIVGNNVYYQPATSKEDNFAAQSECLSADWIENDELFGCLRIQQDQYQLHPGLVHQVNGGVLILSLPTLLMQPRLWFRLKQMVTTQRFQWLAPDDAKPLPLSIPDMPLDLRVILVGTAIDLADFQEIEPTLSERACYGEFESQLLLTEEDTVIRWCRYVTHLAHHAHLPPLHENIWAPLFHAAIRQSGAHYLLPLCPLWISGQLREVAHYAKEKLDAHALKQAQKQKEWRLGYLQEKLQTEILTGQLSIATEGQVIGQINGLSILEFPGFPHAIGEPSRISCVAHIGDGELTDVDRKVDLAGSLHAKGMMIMQAFLISELELEHPFPFAASVVFEQSYGEIDGDSASLAELSAFISALSQQPIQQCIAVTGSVDQFGNVQPVGGINEKIEGFFSLCERRGLTGEQGVILPAANLINLCLNEQVIKAVREGMFNLWAVDSVADALPILTGIPYRSDDTLNLLALIQGRVSQATTLDKRHLPRGLRWLSWFSQ